MPGTQISAPFENNSPWGLDSRSTKPNANPWDSVEQALVNYPLNYRKPGKQVLIDEGGTLVRYWFDMELNLVPEPMGSGDSVTNNTILQLGFVSNVAALRSSSLHLSGSISVKKQVDTLGHTYLNDGGSNTFIWNSESYQPDDNGATVRPSTVMTSEPGRWEMLTNETLVDTRKFGALDDYQDGLIVSINGTNGTITKRGFLPPQTLSGDNAGNAGPGQFRFWGIEGGFGYSNVLQYNSITPLLAIGNKVEFFNGTQWNSLGVVTGLKSDGAYLSNPSNYNLQQAPMRVTLYGNLTFTPNDIGKIIVVLGGRNYPIYKSDENVEANLKITSVDSNGVATYTNLDTGFGTITSASDVSAIYFTDGTDGINNAIQYGRRKNISLIKSGDGKTGIIPYSTQTGQDGIVFNVYQGQKIDVRLVVEGRTNTTATYVTDGAIPDGGQPSNPVVDQMYYIGNGGDRAFRWTGTAWESQVFSMVHRYRYVLFYLNVNGSSPARIDFTNPEITIAENELISSGHVMFLDYNNFPERHATSVYINNLKTRCTSNNFTLLMSSAGVIYDEDWNIVHRAVYKVTNSDIRGFGSGFDFKGTALLPDNKYNGKDLIIEDTTTEGGTHVALRQYNDQTTFEKIGGEYFVQVNNAGFTWWNFNEHAQREIGDNHILKPYILLRKKVIRTVATAVRQVDGSILVTLNAGTAIPVTNPNAECVIGYGTSFQVASWFTNLSFITQTGTSITANSNTITIHGMEDVENEMLPKFIGKEIRIYYAKDIGRVSRIINPKRAKLRLALNGTNAVNNVLQTENTLSSTDLDVTVNFFSPPANNFFGHFVYAGAVNMLWKNLKVKKVAKFVMRRQVSAKVEAKGNSGLSKNRFENVDIETVKYNPTNYGTLQNQYIPIYQNGGDADFIDCSPVLNDTFISGKIENTQLINAGGAVGGNTTITNANIGQLTIGAGTTRIENCIGSITTSPDSEVIIRNSTIDIGWNGGNFTTENNIGKIITINLSSTFDTNVQQLHAEVIGGRVTEIENTGLHNTTITGYTDLQINKWRNAVLYQDVAVPSSLRAPVGGGYKYKRGYLTFGDRRYLTTLTEQPQGIFIGGVYPPHIGQVTTITNNTMYTTDLSKRVLWIDGSYNYYEIDAPTTTIDGIYLLSRIADGNFNYVGTMQQLIKPEQKLTIIVKTAGTTFTPNIANLILSSGSPRLEGDVIDFMYDGTNWVEQ